jgi:hypothetical protein
MGLAGIPKDVLLPRTTWRKPQLYDDELEALAQRFVKNFQRYVCTHRMGFDAILLMTTKNFWCLNSLCHDAPAGFEDFVRSVERDGGPVVKAEKTIPLAKL